MPLHQTLSALALISLTALSTAQLDPKFSGQTCPVGYERQIEWEECGGEGQNSDGLECATLDVPLDYEFPGDTTQVNRIPLIRIPRNSTVTGPRKAIVYNPGGPGSGGISSLAKYEMPDVWLSAEGQYDVVTFDPRGVGLSNPFINANGQNTNYKCTNKVASRSYETDTDISAAIKQVNDQGATCNTAPISSWGALVGSAYVARDIVAISNAVNDDKKIRYYGASYGTLLGATLAQMFPLQLDRVVLDGNINPLDYYYGLGDETVADVDRAVTNFFRQCVENENDKCALADDNVSTQDLQNQWDQYLDTLYKRSARNETVNGKVVSIPRFFEWRQAKQTMNKQLFDGPGDGAWVTYAEDLKNAFAAVKSNPSGLSTRKLKRQQTTAEQITYDASETASKSNSLILQAVTCGDYFNPNGYTPSNSTFQLTLSAWKSQSKYMYDNYIKTQFTCFGWQTPAKERYYPRNGKTATSADILFVQTLYDPVTPEISAERSMGTFANAGILKSSGAGHCSNAQQSETLDKRISNYWSTGTIEKQTAPDVPTIANAFDYNLPKDDQTDDADEVGGNGADEDNSSSSTQKRDIWQFPRHLLEKPFEASHRSRRAFSEIPVGCKPVKGSNTTTTSSTTTTTGTGTTTSTGSVTTSTTGTGTTTSSTSSISYTSKPSWATGNEWQDWSSTTSGTSSKPSWATGDEWNDWQVTTTAKSDPTPAWGAWESGSDYKTFTKTSTIVSTISKCPTQITGCKDVVSTTTVTVTTVYPTVTIYKTDIVEICPTGLTSKPVTVTATCTDGCSTRPTGAPPGYTVSKVWCAVCEKPGFVDVTSTVYVYGNKPADPTTNWNNYGNAASTKTPAAATPATWNDWGSNGASTKSPSAATPASGNWGDWGSAGPSGASKTQSAASPSSTGWNSWDITGTSASKTPAAATGIKTYTGAAAKQAISVSVLFAGLVAVLLL